MNINVKTIVTSTAFPALVCGILSVVFKVMVMKLLFYVTLVLTVGFLWKHIYDKYIRVYTQFSGFGDLMVFIGSTLLLVAWVIYFQFFYDKASSPINDGGMLGLLIIMFFAVGCLGVVMSAIWIIFFDGIGELKELFAKLKKYNAWRKKQNDNTV